MTEIVVRCDAVTDGDRCRVRVTDERGTSEYDVAVGTRGGCLPAIVPTPGFDDMERLVRETIVFLLEREPRTAILPAFDLCDVSRYFPEYPAVIRARLAR